MVGKLAPNASHSTRGLAKYVPGRGYFRAVSSQYGDKFVTSPPPQSLNGSGGVARSGRRARTVSSIVEVKSNAAPVLRRAVIGRMRQAMLGRNLR